MEVETTVLHIRVSRELAERIGKLAKQDDRSVNYVAARLLAKAVKVESKE